jgi:hypothetical protein
VSLLNGGVFNSPTEQIPSDPYYKGDPIGFPKDPIRYNEPIIDYKTSKIRELQKNMQAPNGDLKSRD